LGQVTGVERLSADPENHQAKTVIRAVVVRQFHQRPFSFLTMTCLIKGLSGLKNNQANPAKQSS
jgi:hypothetical protein